VSPGESMTSIRRWAWAGLWSTELDAEHSEPADAVVVAAHDWDIADAQSAGMRTVFLARGRHGRLRAGQRRT
jgi:FMN phosphatase YigB (HAD superfamily)